MSIILTFILIVKNYIISYLIVKNALLNVYYK